MVTRLGIKGRKDLFNVIGAVIRSPFLWLGLTCGVTNIVLWCSALKDFDLSYAYPFLSVSYIIIIVSGKLLFDEHIDQNKMIGIGFIALGALALFIR